MTPEQEAAINFIRNCRILYPDVSMMDEDTRRMYDECWQIFSQQKPIQKASITTQSQLNKTKKRKSNGR